MEWEGVHEHRPRRRWLVGWVVLAAAVIGWLVRSPAEMRELHVDPTPEPTVAEVAPSPTVQAPEGLFGVDDVLPVARGRWREHLPPGGWDATQERVALWDGTEVVVVDASSAWAYDPAVDQWRGLPAPPSVDTGKGDRQGLVVDGTVVVNADSASGRSPSSNVLPPTEEAGRSAAWALTADDWAPVTSIPDDVAMLGAADGAIISARYTRNGDALQMSLWQSVVTADEPTALPPPPVAVQFAQVVDTPDGFVVLGSTVVGGTGSAIDPFEYEGVGLHWARDGWVVLDLPATDLLGAAAVWVPAFPGAAPDPGPEGWLMIIGGQHVGPEVPATGHDLATGVTVDLVLPRIEQPRDDRCCWWSAEWDGQDTVWVFGGYAEAVQLAVDLPTGQLSVASPTAGRVRAELAWDGEGLLLLGGFGLSGPVDVVERWAPTP